MKFFACLQSVMLRSFPYCAPSHSIFNALVAEMLLGGASRNVEEVVRCDAFNGRIILRD